MKATLTILARSVVREYYRQNVGFIFVVLLFAAAFLRAIEHITLGKLAVQLPFVLALYCLIWAIYAAKTIFFTLRMFENPAYSFLYNLALLPKFKRWLSLGFMQTSLYNLAFFYSIFVLYLGIKEQSWWAVFSIILVNLALIIAGVFVYDYHLKRPNAAQVSSKFSQNFLPKFRTTYPFFYLRFLLNKQPILLFLSKVFACFLLFGICKLYPTDDYDYRLLSLGGLFAAAVNVILVQRNFEFENQYLPFLKNLPIHFTKRLFEYAKIIFLLLLSEFLVLFRYIPAGVSYLFIANVCAFIFSLNFLIISCLYLNIHPEKFLVRVFYGGVLVFLMIMFKIPILLISFLNFAAGFEIFRRNYYKSENFIS